MRLVLHPRAAPASTLRVWLGAFGITAPPATSWTIDGAPATPVPLRPLESVRQGALLDGNPLRAFAGVYEFRNLQPARTYEVIVRSGAESASRRVRTLPDGVTSVDQGGFNILLASCFYRGEAPQGVLDRVVRDIVRVHRPDLTVLMGDQVYLDLPTLKNFPDDAIWMARRFEEDYARNWGDATGFASLLAAAPSVSVPDDHEYWNNFPNASPFIQNSWTEGGRRRWRDAAVAAFRGFQEPLPEGLAGPVVLDVPPVSIFLADSRSLRREDRSECLPAAARVRLREWVSDLNARRRIGVFVTGQPLFDKPMATLTGGLADWALPNYGDYPEVVRVLAGAWRCLICMTGDVHWGRALRASNGGGLEIFEVICSPSALVSTIGADQVKTAWNFLKGLFGASDPWPRHGSPKEPPEKYGKGILPLPYGTATLRGHRGDQLAVLTLDWTSQKLSGRVTYWPLSQEVQDPTRVELFHFSHPA